VDNLHHYIDAVEAKNKRMLEVLRRIRGWREIGSANTLGEKLRAIEGICDEAIAGEEE
jgi:hypothetical protein